MRELPTVHPIGRVSVDINNKNDQKDEANAVLKQHLPRKNHHYVGVLAQTSVKTGDNSQLGLIGEKGQEKNSIQNKSNSVRMPQKHNGNVVIPFTPIRRMEKAPVMGIGNAILLNSADATNSGKMFKGQSLPRTMNEKVQLRQ